jgi:hypothetical protein
MFTNSLNKQAILNMIRSAKQVEKANTLPEVTKSVSINSDSVEE